MYQCGKCGTPYPDMTQDGCCAILECWGEPLVEASSDNEGAEYRASGPEGLIEGLCILVCDISYSMSSAAFDSHSTTKLDLVISAVERAIEGLSRISKRETAHIAIILFGGSARLLEDSNGRAFIKSIAQIEAEYPGGLGTYIRAAIEGETDANRKYTDITEALSLARQLFDAVVDDNLSDWIGDRTAALINHDGIITLNKETIAFPNVRVMIYSDGSHNPEDGTTLENPFEDMNPSPVMTAFIGDETTDESIRAGADQMKWLANQCPMHGQKGYFLINSLERHAVLKGLFHMASGATGFCPQCLKASGLLLLPGPRS